jgi:hypothetical protein
MPDSPSKETDAKARFQRAMDYWIKHDPLPTLDELTRVAKKFAVRREDLETAIKMRAELEAKKDAVRHTKKRKRHD